MEKKETKELSKLEKIKAIKKIKLDNKKKIIAISVIAIVGIIIITLITIFAVNIGKKAPNGGIESIFSIGKEITEEKAIEKALKKFNEMGENKLAKEDIEVLKILREGQYYYYISSPENSLEIRISDGKITRENSVLLDE